MKKLYLLTIAIAFTILCNAQSSSFTFIHLSDLHVSTVPSSVNQCDLNGTMAHCYLDAFNAMEPRPAFILCTGDISNIGNSTAVPGGMYTALTQYLYPRGLMYPGVGSLFIDSAKTIPIYFAPGNHEYYTTLTGFSFSTETLPLVDSIPNYVKYIGPDSNYAVTNNISVVLFMRSGYDISYLISTDPKGSGYTDAQISWMRGVLAQNQNKRKIIVMHHPPADADGYKCGIANYSGNGTDSSSSFYYNRDEFLNICDSFKVDLVLAGHVHQNVVVDRHGNVIDENCDTCGTRFVQTGPAFASCYRAITVDSSFITVSKPMLSCDSTSSTTGLPAIEKELDISIYPQPSNGLFNVTFGEAMPIEVRIYNVLGELVHQQSANTTTMQVDMRQNADGFYLMQVITDRNGTPVTYTMKYPLIVGK